MPEQDAPLMLVAVGTDLYHEKVGTWSVLLKCGPHEKVLYSLEQDANTERLVQAGFLAAWEAITDHDWPTIFRTNSKTFLASIDRYLDGRLKNVSNEAFWDALETAIVCSWVFDYYDDRSYYYRQTKLWARSILAACTPKDVLTEDQISTLGGRIPEDKLVKLWAKANGRGWEKLGVRRLMSEYGILSSADVPVAFYEDLMSTLASEVVAAQYNDLAAYEPWKGLTS